MDNIVKRLLESKELIPAEYMNAKDHSSEAYELHDILDSTVGSIVRDYDDGIDMDDTTLTSRGSVDGDRRIIWSAQLYRYKDRVQHPLSKRDVEALYKKMKKEILLPGEDDRYEYSVDVAISRWDATVTLHREEKLDWEV